MATGVTRAYSYFRATTAFIFDARRAGYNPASNATAIGKNSANSIRSAVNTGSVDPPLVIEPPPIGIMPPMRNDRK